MWIARKAQQVGLRRSATSPDSLLTSLSGSFQTSPQFWLNWKNGVSYNIAVQTPQYTHGYLAGFGEHSHLTSSSGAQPQILGQPREPSTRRGARYRQPLQREASHRHLRLGARGRTCAAWRSSVDQIVARTQKASAARIAHRGSRPDADHAVIHQGLIGGLLFAIVLVYLLIVVNFQSWLDPFIIIAALPAALAESCGCSFITDTHISVPALTGSIMCMGVATANSILVVSFAREADGRRATRR